MASNIILIQSSKVKAKLRGNSFQVKAEVYQSIDDFLSRALDKLIEGAQSANIKSIGINDVVRILGRPKKETKTSEEVDSLASGERSCKRCGGINSKWIDVARQLQTIVSDEAVKLYNKNL